MLVALNPESASKLNKQFQNGTVSKRYIAMLQGSVSDDAGEVTAPIAKDKRLFPKVKICHDSGKPSVSNYRVLRRLENPRRCLVEFTPVTGRTHQLRIHSLEMGHPILGCDLYNIGSSETMAERLMLHASELSFMHPRSGEQCHWKCPAPF